MPCLAWLPPESPSDLSHSLRLNSVSPIRCVCGSFSNRLGFADRAGSRYAVSVPPPSRTQSMAAGAVPVGSVGSLGSGGGLGGMHHVGSADYVSSVPSLALSLSSVALSC